MLHSLCHLSFYSLIEGYNRSYGDYATFAFLFCEDANKGVRFRYAKYGFIDYIQYREEEIMAKKRTDNRERSDFGYDFLDFRPNAEEKKAIQELTVAWDELMVWLFDLLENNYVWKWKSDTKNHCIIGQLSCEDEGSPNHKKMIFLRHRDPSKVLLMAFFYDTVVTEGIWEKPEADNYNW